MLNKFVTLLTDPHRPFFALLARTDRAGLDKRYRRLAERSGFSDLNLVLSFDCDTREDADVVATVNERLLGMGITPVYAVPGELLNANIDTYRQIAASGGEFINHGYRDHTYFDQARGRYASCFFYDQLPAEIVRQDIIEGDRSLRESLGIEPQGFRAPHFGTFQRPSQLRFQHGVLRELGYRFSTSTLPIFAYRFGPAFRKFGVLEIPVSGMGSMPMRILDSWSCFAAPDRKFDVDDFVREGRLAAEGFRSIGIGLLNFYADPSHIYDRPEFFETVALWAEVAKPTTYSRLLAKLS